MVKRLFVAPGSFLMNKAQSRKAKESGYHEPVRKQKDSFELRIARDIGATTRRFRETRGISVDQIAALLGCTSDAVRKCETGKRRYSVADILRLALLYDCPTDDLIFGKGPRPTLTHRYNVNLMA